MAALRFIDDLQRVIDEQDTVIREQELSPVGENKSVWLQWGDGSFNKAPAEVFVDKFGHVHVPIEYMGNGQKKKLKGVGFHGQKKEDVKKIVHTETRYEGETLKYIVCHLEG